MAKKCAVRHPWYLALLLVALPATARAEVRDDDPLPEMLVDEGTMDSSPSATTAAYLEGDSDAWKVKKCAAAIT
jgi:hypothetical protein